MPRDGVEAFRRAAKALNEAADKELRKEVNAAFRRAARPLGQKIIAEGSAELPQHGGLAGRVAKAKIGQSNSTRGKNPGVTIRLRTAPSKAGQSYDLKTIDAGIVRHPDFGNRRKWSVTKVRPRAFTRPFLAGRDDVEKEVLHALEAVADRIARQS